MLSAGSGHADAFVSHARIAPGTLERRTFQEAIARACQARNTLVILPTGLGKTVVALLVLVDRLDRVPGKVLFLAPTKPLVEQHAAFLETHLTGAKVGVATGEVSPEERELLWRDRDVIAATPQVVHNDLLTGRVALAGVSLVLFDEAHRAVGDYAYPFIARKYLEQAPNGRILGMTASPGADPERIQEVCRNLAIEGVEIRTDADPDVRPYLQRVSLEWIEIPMPEQLRAVADPIRLVLEEDIAVLRRAGLVRGARVGTGDLLEAQAAIQARIREASEPGELFHLQSVQARALKANHALELVETQGVGALQQYFLRLEQDRSRAARQLLDDARIRRARAAAEGLKMEHPKLRRVAVLIRQQLAARPESRIIVFTHYRDTSELLQAELAKIDGVKPARFVGHAARGEDKGLSQKEQSAILDAFRAGEANVLVATSVAEEGLDIPTTDMVIFYEPVPSEIRTIQRRGRTGRRAPGRVVILITKGTRDEAYYWSAVSKERKMRGRVEELRNFFGSVNASLDVAEARTATPGAPSPAPQKPLDAFPPKAIEIVVDHREFNSPVVRELSARGVAIKPGQLAAADFVLSDRLAVERKTAEDLAASLIDGRLFPQLKALRASYPSPVLVIEGHDFFTARRLSPDAIHGALASIVADFRIPVIVTGNAKETAGLLAAMARREQDDSSRRIALRGEKGPLTEDDQLQFVLEGIPGISGVLAQRLLREFRSVKSVVDADEASLQAVDGIGPVLAKRIHAILHRRYRG